MAGPGHSAGISAGSPAVGPGGCAGGVARVLRDLVERP